MAERYALAAKAFSHTAEYDGMISNWLTARDERGEARDFPDRLNQSLRLAQTLRYGENPHQTAAFYVERDPPARHARRASASCRARSSRTTTSPTPTRPGNACRSFDVPACVIVKHANPCGVAVAADTARRLPQRAA